MSMRFGIFLCLVCSILLTSIGFVWHQQVTLQQQLAALVNEQRELFIEPSTKRPSIMSAPDLNNALSMPTAGGWAGVQQKAKDTVVQIFSQIAEIDLLQPYRTPNQGQSFGSGFILSDDGKIITNWHVVNNARSVWIQIPSLGKRIIDVDVIGVCPERDLALLQLTKESQAIIRSALGSIPHLSMGDSDSVHRADEIIALGYPLGQHSLKATTGIVSGRESIVGQNFIQMSAPINPGSSGGPSLNRLGEVIGVNSASIVGAQNANYIIPINELKIILDNLHSTALLHRPFLGFVPVTTSDALAEYLGNPTPGGVYVVEVYNKSLMDKAGVRMGDMLYEIDGHKIDNYGELNVPWSDDKISISDYVSRLKLGHDVRVVLYRQGKRQDISLTFGLSEQLPIRMIYPDYEPIDYEIIGGMVIMPLTLNHVTVLEKVARELSKYWETKEQLEPALVITHLFPDSQAHRSRAIGIGSVITEVNGKKVKTLEDLRTTMIVDSGKKFINFKTSNNLFVAFPLERSIVDEIRFSQLYRYPLSNTVQQLAKNYIKQESSPVRMA